LLGLVVLGLGCVDRESVSSRSAALISDQGHDPAGTPGFFFLAPVVPDPPRVFTGVFEPRLRPSVHIERVDPVSGATISTVAILSAETAEKVRRHPRRELYIVRWRTGLHDLDPANAYRLRVLVGGNELGGADLRVGTTAADLHGLDHHALVGVKLGDVLPIAFRIERAAVDKDGDGVFDWEDNCPTVPNPAEPAGDDAVPLDPTPAGCDYRRSDCDPQEVDCAKSQAARQTDTDGDGIGDACECLNVSCVALDACHGAGHCEKTTGTCTAPPLPDQDADGSCDAIDACPSDPRKTAPGVCGCGVPETDSDADGAADCVDGCPLDPNKTSPGVCACGVPDTDTDQDGVPDCNDPCPGDVAKVGAGTCGCGTPDFDSDGDLVADCVDLCPFDPRKVAPGSCGCGTADTDTDADGVPDCNDACPTDSRKVAAGVCGCLVSDVDSDGDGVMDCDDHCPLDPGKREPGVCSCGVSDRDRDFDGTPDCLDLCPDDGTKVGPGVCGCGKPEVDSDGDGAPDCVDFCPTDPLKVAAGNCGCGIPEVDGDGDGAPDCIDRCASDPNKIAPGLCGCGHPEVLADADQDGIVDCIDGCPGDGAKAAPGLCGCGLSDVDTDGDLTPDCFDPCPADPLKVAPGICGCGLPEGDGDGDGVPDCHDDCPTDPTRATGPCGPGPAHVDITWMSVSNIYAQVGPLGLIIDGYITRIPAKNFHGGGGGLKNTDVANTPDVAAVTRVLTALGGPAQVNLLLTGHSHFDHAFDTATWSMLTNSPIIGSRTTCLQAQAQHIPTDRCTVVVGGEKIKLADGVTMRVIRWNHSGDSVTNPEQHDPVELTAPPTPDPVTGGLHAGVAEDFPNGGGGRAFLFTIDGAAGPYSWFFQNSASATDIDVPIVIDGVDYGAPIDNLVAAIADAGLTSVDLWVGSVNAPVARLLPIIRPKAFVPVHWDSFTSPFLNGPGQFKDSSKIVPVLSAAGVKFLTPVQYMDKWRLGRDGVDPVANTAVKEALGFK
jgi:L-ascorbate metabolism protein UlaG (beta-lactamase superfamily)